MDLLWMALPDTIPLSLLSHKTIDEGNFFKKIIVEKRDLLCYNFSVTASDTRYGEEVFHMDEVISLIVAVAAGVICHYIIKWLDGDK